MYKITHAYVALLIRNIANFIVSISLEHFIESKSRTSEECTTTTNSSLELVEFDLVVTYHIVLFSYIQKNESILPLFSRLQTFKAPLWAILLLVDRRQAESEFLLLQCGSILV